MDIEYIYNKISELAQKYPHTDELWEAEEIEQEIQNIIIAYCIEKGYDVNGFPHKLMEKNIDLEEYCEAHDIDVSEAYKQYLDYLILEKADVAEIMWHYTKSFWPDQFESIIEYTKAVKTVIANEGVIKTWAID